jgi:hypothetical protein
MCGARAPFFGKKFQYSRRNFAPRNLAFVVKPLPTLQALDSEASKVSKNSLRLLPIAFALVTARVNPMISN